MDYKSSLLWLATAFALVFAYYLQTQFFLHPDIIYLLNIATRMLSGGHYTNDFFETNPPMIMYLYMPVIILAKHFPLYLSHIFRAYIILMIFVSLCLSSYSLTKILRNDTLLYLLTFPLVIFVLCFLPSHEFGQREHILLIFLLPYLFLCTLRLAKPEESINLFLACIIGFNAGIGLSLKPFFLPLLLLIEGYVVSYQRTAWMLLRVETLTIIITLCLYMLFLFYMEPNYLYNVIPLVSRLYLIGMSQPLYEIFLNNRLIFCMAAMIFYFLFYKKIGYRPLFTILFLALLGVMIALLIPRTLFIYQIFPPFGMSCLVFGVGIGLLLKEALDNQYNNLMKNKKYFIGLTLALIFIIAFPVISCIDLFRQSFAAAHNPGAKRFLNFVQSFYPNMTYLFMSIDDDGLIADLYPEKHGSYVGSFSAFWWENGLLKLQKRLTSKTAQEQLAKDESLLIDIIVRDLNIKKPLFVLVDTKERQKYNYIKQFSTHENFKKAWRNYQIYQEIGRFIIFKRKLNVA